MEADEQERRTPVAQGNYFRRMAEALEQLTEIAREGAPMMTPTVTLEAAADAHEDCFKSIQYHSDNATKLLAQLRVAINVISEMIYPEVDWQVVLGEHPADQADANGEPYCHVCSQPAPCAVHEVALQVLTTKNIPRTPRARPSGPQPLGRQE